MLILFGIICFIVWFVFLKDTLDTDNNTLIASVSLVLSIFTIIVVYWFLLLIGFMWNLHMLRNF